MEIKTKRFIYSFLKDMTKHHGCIAIGGARGTGKTTLFRQLCEDCENSHYDDASGFTSDPNFGFDEYFQRLLEKGIKIVFLDEVCKVGFDLIADCIYGIGRYAAKMSIFITGGVSGIVQNMLDEITGVRQEREENEFYEYYELQPIMYIEQLCWDHGSEILDFNIIREKSSYHNFIDYLKKQNMGHSKTYMQYMKEVVTDVDESYISRTALDDNYVDMDDETFDHTLKYISLSQLIYNDEHGNFTDIPFIGEGIKKKIVEGYETYRSKYKIKNTNIQSIECILFFCELAKGLWPNSRLAPVQQRDQKADKWTDTCVFAYPWLASVCLTDDIHDEEMLLPLWIESAILFRMHYIYYFCDKLRIKEVEQIDLIYRMQGITDWRFDSSIELKREWNEFHGLKLGNEATDYTTEVKDPLGLASVISGCSDGEDGNVSCRLDKIVASLELAYIDGVETLDWYHDCNESIEHLVEKNFNCSKLKAEDFE